MFDVLYVYSGAERLGVLQNEKSIQWVENYRNSGEAKIMCAATAENVAMLSLGNRIYNPDTRTIADIVATDVVEWSGEAELTVRAQTSAAELNRRVIMATEVISNVESGMRRIYTNNRRGLPIEMGAEKGFTETISKEITWDTVQMPTPPRRTQQAYADAYTAQQIPTSLCRCLHRPTDPYIPMQMPTPPNRSLHPYADA